MLSTIHQETQVQTKPPDAKAFIGPKVLPIKSEYPGMSVYPQKNKLKGISLEMNGYSAKSDEVDNEFEEF